MPNVLIRNVPDDNLKLLRAEAKEKGESMQEYLLQTLNQRVAYVRRQETLARIQRRMDERRRQGHTPMSEEDRYAAFDAFDAEMDERAQELADRIDHDR